MPREMTVILPDRIASFAENLAMREENDLGLVIVRAIAMLYTIETRRMDGESVWLENAEKTKERGHPVYSKLNVPWKPMFDKEIDFDGLLGN